MTEELEQLLKNLQLKRILEIYDEQLRAADKDDISYSEFVTRLVRAQYQARQEGALEWRIQRADTGKVVVPTRVVYDVRDHLPALGDFWRVYARGTHQNMSVFGKHYSYMQPGVYLFRLSSGGFDTRQLHDSVYELVVTATDIRGNHSSTVQRFSIHNKPGVVGT